MTVRWAMIGIGKLADLAIAPAIAADPGSQLAAVCSRSQERAEDFAVRHGVTAAYRDYAEMLADAGTDAVYIATPNGLHKQHALMALAAGKHVLVEKPMTLSAREGTELTRAAAAAHLVLAVGFHLRHKSANRAARDLVRTGRIGRISYAHIMTGAGKEQFPYDTWRADPALAGGGTLLNQGTHALDLLVFLTDRAVVEVACLTDVTTLEEVFTAACRLDDGGLATISSHQLYAGTPRDWILIGDKAWLTGHNTMLDARADEVVLHEDAVRSVIASSDLSAYRAEIRSFVAAVRGEAPVNGGGEDGVRNCALVEALYRSARERRTVPVEVLPALY